MVSFENFKLDNGLRVYVIPDPTVSVAVVNVLYDVGSRDEREDKTGFAHLFEHLMFGGSKNIDNYDAPLQKVGGENNAFTTTDYTNYYLTLPAQNIETGFWLESDRMLSLSFNPKVLEVQRKVVIEEYRQRYLNRPYGDVMHHMRKLSYLEHPYKWPVIGKEIKHIEEATMEDVKQFFETHYAPNNAILVVGGNVQTERVKELANKWFGPIPSGPVLRRSLPREPRQTEARTLRKTAKVPQKAIYKAYHIGARKDPDYHATDLLSDVLGRGRSSRLYRELVKEQGLLTQVSSTISGSIDPGWLMVSGFLSEDKDFIEAELQLDELIYGFADSKLTDSEHDKVINQALVTNRFSRIELLEQCMQLAYFALLGDAELINEETEKIASIKKEDILSAASKWLKPENCSTLYYDVEKN